MASGNPAVAAVLAYHARTKHHPHRYAASPGGLDWATQPDPFRTYAGAERVALALRADRLTASYSALYRPGAVPPRPLDREGVGMLFELALGLAAWKQLGGTRWALRCNPSSGNLHPTEGYVLLPAMPGLAAGVYHYDSREHALERRWVPGGAAARELAACLPPDTWLVGLSSIHWREAWKYGERAFRYCQHDLGHAVAAFRYAAAALGWSARLLPDATDPTVAALLGLADPESVAGLADPDREHPGPLLLVGPGAAGGAGPDLARLATLLRAGPWTGRANPLSPAHVPWEAIAAAAAATWREGRGGPAPLRESAPPGGRPDPGPAPAAGASPLDAARLIRQRRSCLALDGITGMEAEAFYALLDRLLDRPGLPPWDAWPWRAQLHCVLFVHRVRGLPPGLYLLERDTAAHPLLRTRLEAEFGWQRPAGCPADLPLFALAEGDCRELAQLVSCHQAIAGDGAFSLGMLAEFGDPLRAAGAWWYRRLFWEAGLLGQLLYLEAEAAGLRGTGIGCFFDDAVHDLLGLRGDGLQSLYHFTVGGPVEDPRLTTLPAYGHLEAARRAGG